MVALGIIGAYILYHTIVWLGWTSKIFNQAPYHVGDLARMSYQINSIHYRKDENDLPKKHLRYTPDSPPQKVDIITIGDSFSNGGGLGRNAFYQDYLASHSPYMVLNIQNYDNDTTPVETISALITNGWLETIKPRVILIQTVARRLAILYGREQRWDTVLPENFQQGLSQRAWRDEPPQPPLVNTANYKLPYYSLMYHLTSFGQKNVLKLTLKEPLFSVQASTVLLLYKEDTTNLDHFNEASIKKINDNFNTLAQRLKELDILLVFMPAVDKYDLYSQAILDNPFPSNPLFDLLEKSEKKYLLINTKKILREALTQGEKDIFYADDTHWSFRASELIGLEIIRKLTRVIHE